MRAQLYLDHDEQINNINILIVDVKLHVKDHALIFHLFSHHCTSTQKPLFFTTSLDRN